MGTSSSSDGSPSGVPLFPPWVPPAPAPQPDDDAGSDDTSPPDGSDENEAGAETSPPPANPTVPPPLAPERRFGNARYHLGQFASNGSRDSMRRGLGHYVNRGLQGARNAASRFEGSSRSAGSLYDALSALAARDAPAGSPLDAALETGRSAEEVMAAIIEAARPVDGTQDSEAARAAMQNALADMLDQFPDADLLALTEEQRMFAVERYLAQDVFNRACLDLGKSFQEKAPSAASAMSRLRDIRDYIRETVASAFRKLRTAGQTLTATRVTQFARDALREAFAVFEVGAT